MKNNDKFFKKAIKKINLLIENQSEVYFSFRSVKIHAKIYFYKLFYNVFRKFFDKDFYDSFVISCAIHLIFILIVIIYTVITGKLYFSKQRHLKDDKVIIFDLSDLKIDKTNKLQKIKFDNKTINKTKIKKVDLNKNKSLKKSKIAVDKSNISYTLKTEDNKSNKNDNKIQDKKKQNHIENKSVNNDVSDDLLIDVKKGIKAESIDDISIPAGIDSSISNNSNDLQVSYISAIKFRVQNCWNIDAGVKGIKNIVVKITVNLFESGYVKNIDILNSGDYNGLPEFDIVSDSARRAIISCAPYKFSSDRYDYWKTVNFNFYPARKSIE